MKAWRKFERKTPPKGEGLLYIDEDQRVVTTEMIMQHPHWIDGHIGFIKDVDVPEFNNKHREENAVLLEELALEKSRVDILTGDNAFKSGMIAGLEQRIVDMEQRIESYKAVVVAAKEVIAEATKVLRL